MSMLNLPFGMKAKGNERILQDPDRSSLESESVGGVFVKLHTDDPESLVRYSCVIFNDQDILAAECQNLRVPVCNPASLMSYNDLSRTHQSMTGTPLTLGQTELQMRDDQAKSEEIAEISQEGRMDGEEHMTEISFQNRWEL